VSSTLPPVVILGGAANALSVARSLGSAGAEVFALGDETSAVRFSRHCRHFVDLGSHGAQGRWLEWLAEGPAEAVVLPCSDDGVELVARHRAWLETHGYRCAEANDTVLLAMLDKARTYELAREAGIGMPQTIVLETERDVETAAQALAFPCALKPLQIHVFAQHFRRKAVVVRDRAAMEAAFERTQALGLRMLATEIVPGPEDQYVSYYSYLDEQGQPLLHFTKRKLRQYPIGFGGGCYHVTEWNASAAELGLRFFQEVGLRGLGNVEFKRDARDGRLKLIECNPRFTAANEQVYLAGIDLALLSYNRVIGRPTPQLDRFREGVRLWLPLEDVLAYRSYARTGELRFGPWVRSLLHRQHFPTFRWTDPLPTLVGLGRIFGRGWRRLQRSSGAETSDPEAAFT
jgi:D-aspartate ligase